MELQRISHRQGERERTLALGMMARGLMLLVANGEAADNAHECAGSVTYVHYWTIFLPK